jgi:hypothetical protein
LRWRKQLFKDRQLLGVGSWELVGGNLRFCPVIPFSRSIYLRIPDLKDKTLTPEWTLLLSAHYVHEILAFSSKYEAKFSSQATALSSNHNYYIILIANSALSRSGIPFSRLQTLHREASPSWELDPSSSQIRMSRRNNIHLPIAAYCDTNKKSMLFPIGAPPPSFPLFLTILCL